MPIETYKYWTLVVVVAFGTSVALVVDDFVVDDFGILDVDDLYAELVDDDCFGMHDVAD